MEVNNIIHEMNEVIREFNSLEYRMNDLRMKLSGLWARVSFYLNTGKDLDHDDIFKEAKGNNSSIHDGGMQTTPQGSGDSLDG